MKAGPLTGKLWLRIGFWKATRHSLANAHLYLVSVMFIGKSLSYGMRFYIWIMSAAAFGNTIMLSCFVGILIWPLIVDVSFMTVGALVTPFCLVLENIFSFGIPSPRGCDKQDIWQDIVAHPSDMLLECKTIEGVDKLSSVPSYQRMVAQYECPVSRDVMGDPVMVLSQNSKSSSVPFQHTMDLVSLVKWHMQSSEDSKYRNPFNRQPILGVFRNMQVKQEIEKLVHNYQSPAQIGS